MKKCFLFFLIILWNACGTPSANEKAIPISEGKKNPYLVVLGIAQDAGYPQAECKKDCCKEVWGDQSKRKMVSCLGLVNPIDGQSYVFDATPDFKDQLNILTQQHQADLGGIFLTHAHMGHYTGLMHLGREAMGAKEIPVYAMPRMKSYLETNGPWSQLVDLKNILLQSMAHQQTVNLGDDISVKPLLVPHRDEFSETVGFLIKGKNKSALFIPDIDKWSKWETNIETVIQSVDIAFLDGTFFQMEKFLVEI